MTHRFLVETYETERLKTLSVWSQVRDDDMEFRAEPRARTPHEHMVHQCVSENAWMTNMLGIDAGLPALPPREDRVAFLDHYAAASAARLAFLGAAPQDWFGATVRFFDVERSRAWVLVRRFTHTAHHRGQLTTLLRLRGHALYSTYGPTADTGGLAQNGAPVVYRYAGADALLESEHAGGSFPALPGPGAKPPVERPKRV
jgi:uncharacterized damage-inducible protein DinB